MLLRSSIIMLPLLLLVATTASAAKSKSKILCANEKGVFVGLAVDVDSYENVAGSTPGPSPPNSRHPDPQPETASKWELVDEKEGEGPKHSIAQKFLQVLPDIGRRFPGDFHQLTSVQDQLMGKAPYVAWKLQVTEEGHHTAFLRWTSGDTKGAADSLYVVLTRNGKVVPGPRTLKPAVAPIGGDHPKFEGCCYDTHTHACPCLVEGADHDNTTCPNFVDRDEASSFGMMCQVTKGLMTFVNDPDWYLFAGQDNGPDMDFSGRPWDATCEAKGSNTADSGGDFANWYLTEMGEYDLRIYAREDGTALDAIYVAGPKGVAPDDDLGEDEIRSSTVCTKKQSQKYGSKGGKSKAWMHFLFFFVAVSGLAYVAVKTERGREIVQMAVGFVQGLRGNDGVVDDSRYAPLHMPGS